MHTQEMLETYPADLPVDKAAWARAIDAAAACAQSCTACADACLSEEGVADLTRCIRDNLDCADVCHTTVNVLSRHTGYDARLTRAVLQACIQACNTCGDSCSEHAGMHEHCKVCAQACRDCEQACKALLGEVEPHDEAAQPPTEAAPQS